MAALGAMVTACAVMSGLNQYGAGACADGCDAGVSEQAGPSRTPRGDGAIETSYEASSDPPGEGGWAAVDADASPTDASDAASGADGAHADAGGASTDVEADGAPDGAAGAAPDGSGATAADATAPPADSAPEAQAPGDAQGATDAPASGGECGASCPISACCPGGGCPTAHSNGLGQTYYDCSPQGTYDQAHALEACAAATGDPTQCTVQPMTCAQFLYIPTQFVCSAGAAQCACWNFTAAPYTVKQNTTSLCLCPTTTGPTWN